MTGSPTDIISAAQLGQTLVFRTKNVSDQVLWRGRIEGFVTASIAQTYTDILTYNAAVRLSDATVSTDLTALNFFIITLDNDTGPAQRYAFATEWILDGSLQIIDQRVKVNVVVYDTASSDHTAILTVLRAGGYSCYIASVST